MAAWSRTWPAARRPGRPGASLLVANLSHRWVEGIDWEHSEFSLYELGQAVAHMTIQAQALGLAARQFRAFDREAIAEEFSVPSHWEVTTMTATGRPVLSPGAGQPPHQRRPIADISWPVA